ncbi:hypothetical protein FAF44_29345 [Nonomuraea sp. MG754425]|uniref:PIN domain-containing protein n=1 Tax=Nonomuraea sp. MG754425 TaxID=2570319 RepID=UPI001F33810A|nr:PIN domain-containing protein [Nonomuraea sp. MG754425]MCF6472469.1 hypothetical protein [Nonomuraea sp. MG754425]
MIGRVLDSSALIAWGSRSSPYVDAVIFSRTEHHGYVVPVVTTAAALTVALAQLPGKAAPVVEALLAMEICVVDELTPGSAPAVAEVLREAGPYAAELGVTAATIVQAAGRRSLPVVTSNPYPLTSLRPDLEIDLIP